MSIFLTYFIIFDTASFIAYLSIFYEKIIQTRNDSRKAEHRKKRLEKFQPSQIIIHT